MLPIVLPCPQRRLAPAVALAIAILAAPLAAGAQEEPVLDDAKLDDLAWLAGRWRVERDGTVTEEVWTEPAGGLMLGLNRQVRPGRRATFEYLRIETDGEAVRYVASPGGGTSTLFPLARVGPGRVAFENPGHDWPQVIEYRLDEADTLHVRAAGLAEGSRALTWTMERVKPGD
ncbi:MAG TPA: DUF6265 family protein [Thermoanaerobaculia bacterium]|nr:DUF6265 family protein [Thermoanaerobaculia bacterium]